MKKKSNQLPSLLKKNQSNHAYLGRGNNERQFVTVSTHQFRESFNNLGGLVQTTILGQSLKEVLGDFTGLTSLLQGGNNTFHLDSTVDGRVFQESSERGILLNSLVKSLEVLFNSFKNVLTSSSSVKSSSITTVKTEKSNRGLTWS
jgi:hypothetical protein